MNLSANNDSSITSDTAYNKGGFAIRPYFFNSIPYDLILR